MGAVKQKLMEIEADATNVAITIFMDRYNMGENLQTGEVVLQGIVNPVKGWEQMAAAWSSAFIQAYNCEVMDFYQAFDPEYIEHVNKLADEYMSMQHDMVAHLPVAPEQHFDWR